MGGRILLVLSLALAAGCGDSTDPERTGTHTETNNSGGVSVSGVLYGFTHAPDSQRVAIAGATVVLIRVGDFVPPGPDTTEVPPLPPPGPDTTLMSRSRLLDSVVPPDTVLPPPPGCAPGIAVATAVTGADGKWSAEGLEAGQYNVEIDPPAGTRWLGIEACGYPIGSEDARDLTFYLPLGPGPDPMP